MTYHLHPILQSLRATDDPEERDRLTRLLAVNIGDDIALATLVGALPPQEEFYPDARPKPAVTDSAIDDFLDAFAPRMKRAPDTLDHVAPAVDYATLVDLEARGAATPAPAPAPSPETPQTADECIKNGQYARALEIIQAQSLNNPEKSVYFADQIRFLRKLLLIEAASRQ